MGDGARRAQMERRFGQGQPVDTYGEQCPHAKQFVDIKNFDGNKFVFKRKMGQRSRVWLPRDLVKKIEKGGIQIEITNPKTGKTMSFYKELRNVRTPTIFIPKAMDVDPGQEMIVKVEPLTKSNFIRQLDGKSAEMVRLNDDSITVTVNFVGKEFNKQIKDLKYGYANNVNDLGGAKYVEFEVKDVFGKSYGFRIYDNGLNEPRSSIFAEGEFRFIEDIDYDAKRDAVVMKYYRKDATAGTTIRFMEPGEIDLDKGMAPEEMRLRIDKALEMDDQTAMGKVGEEIAEKFVKEKLKAMISEPERSIGPDRKIMLNDQPGILEAKLTTYESQLETQFALALYDICRRFDENSEYKQGVAVAVYFNEDTGFFRCIYRIATPETRDTAFEGLRIVDSIAEDIKALGIKLDIQDQPPMGQNFTWHHREEGKLSQYEGGEL